MKVEIDENGVMTITSETPIEAFALRNWSEKAEVRFEDLKRMEEVFIRGGKFITVCSPNGEPS